MRYQKWSARCGGLWMVLVAGVLAGAGPSRLEHVQEHWRWSHFDQSAGLPSSNVQQTLLSDDGTVWVSTAKGVAWYDGYFWHEAVGLDSEPGIRLSTGRGSGVFAFWKGCLFEGGRAGFVPVSGCQPGAQSWLDAIPLDNGEILAALPSREPIVFGPGGSRPAELIGRLSEDQYFQLRQTRGKAVWWADRRGLVRLGRGSGRLVFSSATGLPWRKSIFELAGLAENASGAGVAAVVHPPQWAGIWEWGAGEAPRRIPARAGLEDVRAIDVSDSGETLLVHRSGHVWSRQPGAAWVELTSLPRAFEQVRSVTFGAAGDLWLATETGLHLYRASKPGWKLWAHPFPDSRNSVNALAQARDGTVWIANGAGAEQVRIDPETGELTRVASHTLGLSTGIAQDEAGNIWVSSGMAYGGAWRWDGQSWRRFGRAEGLTDNRIHRIVTDRQRRLWFAALEGLAGDRSDEAGAYLLTKSGFEQWDARKGLLSNHIFSVASAPDGTLYFASKGGLSRYRLGQWRHWRKQGDLKGFAPFHVVVDGGGSPYWVDRASGIGTIDAAERPRYFTTFDGLASNGVWELAFGPKGALWAAGYGGVSVWRGAEWMRFGMEAGFPVENSWPILPVGTRVCAGLSAAGLACIDNQTRPEATRVRINAVEEKDGYVTVEWLAVSHFGYLAPGSIETRYRLDGARWSDWSLRSEAQLARLFAGRHLVEVESRGMEPGSQPARREFPDRRWIRSMRQWPSC